MIIHHTIKPVVVDNRQRLWDDGRIEVVGLERGGLVSLLAGVADDDREHRLLLYVDLTTEQCRDLGIALSAIAERGMP